MPAVLLGLFSAFCLGFATCGIAMPGASASRALEDEMRAMSRDITAIVEDSGGFWVSSEIESESASLLFSIDDLGARRVEEYLAGRVHRVDTETTRAEDGTFLMAVSLRPTPDQVKALESAARAGPSMRTRLEAGGTIAIFSMVVFAVVLLVFSRRREESERSCEAI